MFEPEASDKRNGDQLQQRENNRVRRAIDRRAIDRRAIDRKAIDRRAGRPGADPRCSR